MSTDLWCDVIRSAAESLGGEVAGDALLTHAEVSYLDVPVLIQQNVVQLQISVDDVSAVQVEQPYCDLCGVKPEQETRTLCKNLFSSVI